MDVSEARIARWLKKAKSQSQARQFRQEGQLARILENLERNDGFKGFYQKA